MTDQERLEQYSKELQSPWTLTVTDIIEMNRNNRELAKALARELEAQATLLKELRAVLDEAKRFADKGLRIIR